MSKLSRIPDKPFGSSPVPHMPIRHQKIRVARLDFERRDETVCHLDKTFAMVDLASPVLKSTHSLSPSAH
jgi:hypothetical protein